MHSLSNLADFGKIHEDVLRIFHESDSVVVLVSNEKNSLARSEFAHGLDEVCVKTFQFFVQGVQSVYDGDTATVASSISSCTFFGEEQLKAIAIRCGKGKTAISFGYDAESESAYIVFEGLC